MQRECFKRSIIFADDVATSCSCTVHFVPNDCYCVILMCYRWTWKLQV